MATNEFIPLETSNLQTDTHGQRSGLEQKSSKWATRSLNMKTYFWLKINVILIITQLIMYKFTYTHINNPSMRQEIQFVNISHIKY